MMDKWDIAFPHLGIYLEHFPKSFTVFGFTIALYGVIIALGVLFGFTLANHVANKQGLPKDLLWDFAVPAIIFSVLGARIYYVVFSWDYYKNHLNELLNIRQGGIAIYGAVIGGFLTLLIFCKIRKQNFFLVSDIAVLGLLVGQIMGRWGNFANREVFGHYTDSLFAMRLPIEAVRSADITPDIAAHITDGINYIQVHPTFLYESVLNLLLLIVLLLYTKHKKFNGEIALGYLGGYGIIRFFVEGIRTDQLKIGSTGIAVSQLLGMVLFIAAILTDVIVRIYRRKKELQELPQKAAVVQNKVENGEKQDEK